VSEPGRPILAARLPCRGLKSALRGLSPPKTPSKIAADGPRTNDLPRPRPLGPILGFVALRAKSTEFARLLGAAGNARRGVSSGAPPQGGHDLVMLGLGLGGAVFLGSSAPAAPSFHEQQPHRDQEHLPARAAGGGPQSAAHCLRPPENSGGSRAAEAGYSVLSHKRRILPPPPPILPTGRKFFEKFSRFRGGVRAHCSPSLPISLPRATLSSRFHLSLL